MKNFKQARIYRITDVMNKSVRVYDLLDFILSFRNFSLIVSDKKSKTLESRK